jgi:DNA-binding MarR family transcriptional regulator
MPISSKYPKTRKLTKKQLRILLLTYKFRFITPTLYAAYENKVSRSAMYVTLERLVKSGHLAKRRIPNNNFNNKGGRYYLTPKGFKQIEADIAYPEDVKPLVYKNKRVSEVYVDQYVLTMRIYVHIRARFEQGFDIFTKSEISSFEELPRPLPELYLQRLPGSQGDPYEAFMLLCTDMPLFLVKKRFNALIDHAEEEGWEGEVEYYPRLLFVLADEPTEHRFHAHVQKVKDSTGLDEDEPLVRTTTTDRILGEQKDIEVWKTALEEW